MSFEHWDFKVGKVGQITFGTEQGRKIVQKATVIANYYHVLRGECFAVLVDYGDFQSVVADLDKWGLVQNDEQTLFRFEVAE